MPYVLVLGNPKVARDRNFSQRLVRLLVIEVRLFYIVALKVQLLYAFFAELLSLMIIVFAPPCLCILVETIVMPRKSSNIRGLHDRAR